MNRVVQKRQRLLALSLPVSAALLVIGGALTPEGLDQIITSKETALNVLPIAAAHTDRLYLSNLLVLLGLGALAVSFAAIAMLVGARGAGLATAAALVGGFGAFCGAIANVLVGFNLAASVSARLSPDMAAQYLVATFTSWAGVAILVAYLGSLLIGTLLMAAALWRSQRVPRWLPVLFVISLALGAASPPGPLAIPLQLPFAATMVILGVRAWRSAALPAGNEALASEPARLPDDGAARPAP